jgi:oligoribonuclease NrnB/cAMP/cGMP phosphodiesterase (DHH superfamily)
MNFDFSQTDICIYHRNCGDGFCCAWLVWSTVGDYGLQDIEYIALGPSTKINEQDLEKFAGKNILVVDLSFSEDDLLDIQKVARSVLVLDHHKTAAAALKDLDFAIFDEDECGASLLYREMQAQHPHYFDGEMPSIIDFVKDRDLWNWNVEYSHEVNAYLQTLAFEFSVWYFVAEELNSAAGFRQIREKGSMILETQNRMADELAEYANLVELYTGPERGNTVRAKVVNCSVRELISMTGHRILELETEKPDNKRVEVAIMYSIFPDGGLLFSVRSVPSFDASVIASAWGGGGHKNACGFKGRIENGLPWLFEKNQ